MCTTPASFPKGEDRGMVSTFIFLSTEFRKETGMNIQLQTFARTELKHGLAQCTDKQVMLFKRMYSHGNLNLSINEVVNNMPAEKLDWALQQVENTLKLKKGVNNE